MSSMIDSKPYGSPKVYSTLLACIQCSSIVESSQLNNAMLCLKCRAAVKCKYCRTECKNPKSSSAPVCDYCDSSLKQHGKPKKCEQCQMLCAFGKPKCARCTYNIKKFGKPVNCEHCHNKAAWEGKKVDNRLLCYPCAESYKKVLGKFTSKTKSSSENNIAITAASVTNNSSTTATITTTNGGSKRERATDFTSRLSTTNDTTNGTNNSNGSITKKSRNDSFKFISSLPTSNSSLLTTSNMHTTSTHGSSDLLSSTDNLATVSRLQEKILSLEKQLQSKNSDLLMKDVKITEIKASLAKEQKECREKILDMEKNHQDRLQDLQSKINDLNKQIALLTKKNKKIEHSRSSVSSSSSSSQSHPTHFSDSSSSSSSSLPSNRRQSGRRKSNGRHRNGLTTPPTTTTTTTTEYPSRGIIDPCSMEAFESCLALMRDVMQNRSLAFPTNHDELNLTCKKLKAGDYCAERYIRSCAGDQQRLLYQDIVHGTKNVIRLICQQGDTQKQYLKFASCFKDISESEQKCASVLRRFQHISDLLALDSQNNPQQESHSHSSSTLLESFSQVSDDEKLMQFCCSYRDVVECQSKNVRTFCGEAGLEFFDRYISEMTGSLIKEHCVGYTYGGRCVKTHSTHQRSWSSPHDRQSSTLHSSNLDSTESDLTTDNSASSWTNALQQSSLSLCLTVLVTLSRILQF